MVEILQLTFLRPPGTKLLDAADIQQFSMSPRWTLPEAVMLSLGYHPNRNVDGASIEAIGLAARDRWDVLNRAMLAGQIPFKNQPLNLSDAETTVYAFTPRDMMTWLEKTKLSYPANLYSAVMGRESACSAPIKTENKTKASTDEPPPPPIAKNGYVEFRKEIAEYALEFEYEKGCSCCHTKLAPYLMALTNDKSLRFPPPPKDTKRYKKQNTPMIRVFTEAAKVARQASGLKVKGEKGFKDLGCKKHPQIK